jgi:hypothetical protein
LWTNDEVTFLNSFWVLCKICAITFSGDQPCQYWTKNQRLRDLLSLHLDPEDEDWGAFWSVDFWSKIDMVDRPRKFYHLLNFVWMRSKVSSVRTCFDWCHFLSAADPVSCHFCTVLTLAVCWIKVNWNISEKIYERIYHKFSCFYCNTQYYTTPCFNTTTEKDCSWQFLRIKIQKLTEINCKLVMKMGLYSNTVHLHQFMSHCAVTAGWIIDCLNENIIF